jgi:hypothetical protein
MKPLVTSQKFNSNTQSTTPPPPQQDPAKMSEAPTQPKTNGGVMHQSPLWAPSQIQVIQGEVVLKQLQVEDWEDEAFDDEAAEEAELARVQQEIEHLYQEQEAITDRQATTQRVEVRR